MKCRLEMQNTAVVKYEAVKKILCKTRQKQKIECSCRNKDLGKKCSWVCLFVLWKSPGADVMMFRSSRETRNHKYTSDYPHCFRFMLLCSQSTYNRFTHNHWYENTHLWPQRIWWICLNAKKTAVHLTERLEMRWRVIVP